MSSKPEEAGTTLQTGRPLVPTLRFPEFRDAGEWDNEPMAELYAFKGNNSFSRDKLNYEIGSVKNIHYGDIHTKFSAHFEIQNEMVPYINPSECLESIDQDSYCVEGDMVFADASEDVEDIGKCIEVITLNNERLLSGLHTILARQKEKRILNGFGGHLFRSDRIRKQIQKESQGTKVFGLSARRLAKIEICYPKDKAEQQKIADCLSSVDDLIALEAQKLDALKTHKKGLMQQLFPAEGETIPKLRFPEFRDAGEWEEKQIGDLKPFVTSGSRGWAAFYANQGSLFVRITNLSRESIYLDLTDSKFVSLPSEENEGVRTQLRECDVLISITADIGIIGYIDAKIPAPAYINQHIALVRFDALQVCSKYVSYFLASERSQRLFCVSTDTGTKAGMSLVSVQKIKLVLPIFPEQQKIADCLSSVDDLIALQAQKLDALKAHKKGLMQRLFPASDEVPA